MLKAGYFINNERGGPYHADWPDRHATTRVPVSFYDSTSADARAFVWEQLRDNYYRYGIKTFWLDACEPELKPAHVDNLRLSIGPGPEVLNRYPADNARTVYEGMRSVGESEVVTLTRSAWAGSQKWGAFLWSGDIPATFESLAAQVRAGLNVGRLRHPVVVNGHRRVPRRRPERPRVPRAGRPMVPVRHVVPLVPAARGPLTSQPTVAGHVGGAERSVVLRRRRLRDPG